MHMPIAGTGMTPYRRQFPGPSVPQRIATRAVPVMRRYTVSYLNNENQIIDFQKAAPALPLFENGFSAFARGTLIMTEFGPCAIEDLLPGTRVQTGEGNYETLLWRGGMTIIPNAPTPQAAKQHLTRVSMDRLGSGIGGPDLLLGPAARIVQQHNRFSAKAGVDEISVPVGSLVDGETVIEVNPVSAVDVFHLAFGRHTTVRVGGLVCESYHPGPDARISLSRELTPIFLSLFPFVSNFGDFGALSCARMSSDDARNMVAA